MVFPHSRVLSGPLAGRALLFTVLALLIWMFWTSPDGTRVAAGVAVFLFGMRFMEDGFRAFTGGALERLLARCTGSIWMALLFGVFVTALVQSSSLVSVLTISFMSAGLLSLRGGIGIIFGANLGTTTGAWLVAGLGFKVDLAAYALPMLVMGAALGFQKGKTWRGAGLALAGLGFLFMGIQEMKDGFDAFRDTIDLAAFAMPGIPGLLVYALLGTIATVIMQSSHATLILILTALSAGQITYENGLALAIGANLGTTITAVLGALGANAAGRRLAAAHVAFNGVTGLVAILALPLFKWGVEEVALAVGLASDDLTMRLAIFHSLFNLVGVALMLPLVGRLEDLLYRVLPDRTAHVTQPKYLSDTALAFPEAALEAARKEVSRLYDHTREVACAALGLDPRVLAGEGDLHASLAAVPPDPALDVEMLYDTRIKPLHAAIVEFIARAGSSRAPETRPLMGLYRASNRMAQAVKDMKHLHKNASRMALGGNERAREEYLKLRVAVGEMLRAVDVLLHEDAESRDPLALDLVKVDMERADPMADGHVERLIRAGAMPGTVATSLVNDFGYARRIVWNLADAALSMVGVNKDGDANVAESLALTEGEVMALGHGGPPTGGEGKT
ncbi:MAG: Na/Pi symporter [Rhodospirillum sp.]|nr:Na/Pi symporter [Rhodospirillum sp.]MCF8491229.1 Na/Pi symporter [Rhodospirillum sp.]MCF8500865.1 Na/Pi symporter [Rhodospirillum sp.]